MRAVRDPGSIDLTEHSMSIARWPVGVLFAFVVLAGSAGQAAAETAPDRPEAFCRRAKNVAENVPDSLDPTDLDAAVEKARADVKALARLAPKRLEKPFRTIREFYDEFLGEDSQAVDQRALGRLNRAGRTISRYLVEKCDVSIESLGLPSP